MYRDTVNDDSICKSLRLFGIISKYMKDEHQKELDAIRQDFQSNGIDRDIHTVTNPQWKLTRKQPRAAVQTVKMDQHCVFCLNNGEPEMLVRSHAVRDSLGIVRCPKLRLIICPLCGMTGDNAHTIKYCPRKPIITMEDIYNRNLNFFKRYYLETMKCLSKF